MQNVEGNSTTPVTMQSPPADKITLFRRLFRGREDVFARRFESKKTGKSGYQPACANEWRRGVCGKPQTRCASCPQRAFIPVSDAVIHWHLRGQDDSRRPFAMGTYPMLADETVWFAAADFDKASWREDVAAVREAARMRGFEAAVERSRSGNGAHVWFFFDAPVAARDARDFVSRILDDALERSPGMGLDSYDRIFPNQDTMPKGGFGNLIALPLQGGPRRDGNSVFVTDAFEAHPDQWAYLSSVRPIAPMRVAAEAAAARATHRVLLVPAAVEEEASTGDPHQPWSLFAPEVTVRGTGGASPAPTKLLEIVLSNRIYVETAALPSETYGRLVRLAAFVNPGFWEAQRMRRSVHGIPRVISCAERGEKHLALPRGCREAALKVLAAAGFAVTERDERYGGVPLETAFQGELRPEQREAVHDLERFDTGVLAAGTAFGKTVAAAWMIARRRVNTLVLVNRRELQEQWVSRLETFLALPGRVGRIGGGAGESRRTGVVDVGLIQSLSRKGGVKSLVKEYGHIVVDECHAISAPAFERVLDGTAARYVLGLSATVVRKDGHHPIVFMQCGPVRHRADGRISTGARAFAHRVIVRPTAFRPRLGGAAETASAAEDARAVYSALCDELSADGSRNRLVADDALAAVEEGRSPVVLTERRGHLEALRELLDGKVEHLVVLCGGMGRREAAAVRMRLARIPDCEGRILLATGAYLGEGFDDARLDTLLLAMPISWKGRITQYVGRLHRSREGKTEVRVFDYLDGRVALFNRMFDRRCRGYEAMGYEICLPPGVAAGWPADVPLPVNPGWPETHAESVRRLCRDGVDSDLANLFVWASRQVGTASPPDARAAALRFLLKRLDTLPATRGRFRDNVRLAIPCGVNPDIEVALCDADDRLAVQLDAASEPGDCDAYRRARREDILLQANEFRVIRFLVPDVALRLSAVLDAILRFQSRTPAAQSR